MAHDERKYRFDDFLLDTSNRQLWHGDTRLDLNARYFDALVLLVRAQGQLVEKDRFFEEVWGDVVVSDAALTQCVKDIRKQLGDDASNPRYILTVPRYGYKFIATVETVPAETPAADVSPPEETPPSDAESSAAIPRGYEEEVESSRVRSTADTTGGAVERPSLQRALSEGAAGTVGGAAAGVVGGLLYGFGSAYAPAAAELGTASILIVLLSLNVVVGVMAGLGVSFGMAAGGLVAPRQPAMRIAGAAFGGMVVGALVKLLGVDAFNLLFGRAPAGIAGGMECGALGFAAAVGAQLGGGLDALPRWRPVLGAGVVSAVAGVLIPLAGGHLMGGSLDLLARSFAGSRLQLDALGRFFGELHFGYTSQVILGGIEGLVLGSCIIGAIVLARHRVWKGAYERSGLS